MAGKDTNPKWAKGDRVVAHSNYSESPGPGTVVEKSMGAATRVKFDNPKWGTLLVANHMLKKEEK